jgi:hypothetical protein
MNDGDRLPADVTAAYFLEAVLVTCFGFLLSTFGKPLKVARQI